MCQDPSTRRQPDDRQCLACRSLSDAIRDVLWAEGPDGITQGRRVAEALVSRAVAGDVEAARLILEWTEGR